jgi:hypothetical protein
MILQYGLRFIFSRIQSQWHGPEILMLAAPIRCIANQASAPRKSDSLELLGKRSDSVMNHYHRNVSMR